jgi:hypothetical protein
MMGSQRDPELAQRRPWRSVTVTFGSDLMRGRYHRLAGESTDHPYPDRAFLRRSSLQPPPAREEHERDGAE